jgi:hypothetical protein
MARSLASEGYAVVTIDHPYDASVVEFPNGKIIKTVGISDEDIPALTKLTQVSTHQMDVNDGSLRTLIVIVSFTGSRTRFLFRP